MIFALWACAIEAAPPPPPALALLGVEVREDGQPIATAAQATLGADGQGAATAPHIERAGADGVLLHIAAPRSTWDLKTGAARFEGGVTLTRAGTTLVADTLTLRFGPGALIEEAVAAGAVTLRSPGRGARADRATLYAPAGRVVLTGAAQLFEGGNTLSGEPITLWLDDERVECAACRLELDARSLPR